MGILDGIFDVGKNLLGMIPAVGPAISSVVGGAQSMYDSATATSAARDATQEEYARQDTAIQRRVADLKAAGLAPQLAAGGGAVSSAPIMANQSGEDLAGEAQASAEAEQARRKQQDAAATAFAQDMLAKKASIDQTSANTDLIRQRMQWGDQDREQKANQDLVNNALHSRLADIAQGKAVTSEELDSARAAFFSDKASQTEVATAIARRDGIPMADAVLKVEQAIGSLRSSEATGESVTSAPRDALLKAGLSPIVVDAILGAYNGLSNLAKQGAHALGIGGQE